MDAFLEKVIARGLIQPGTNGRDEVLSNDALLSELAALWRAHRNAIEALLKARLYPIEREIVAECTPYELLFLRQSLIEVAYIGDDLEAYAVEHERREKERKGGTTEGLSPPVGAPAPDNEPATTTASSSSM